jgi:AhpD family alkylhydroperoxidase
MNARLNLSGSPLAAKSMKYMASASKVVIEGSTLPKSTENMVMLRASQINGCGFCAGKSRPVAAHQRADERHVLDAAHRRDADLHHGGILLRRARRAAGPW